MAQDLQDMAAIAALLLREKGVETRIERYHAPSALLEIDVALLDTIFGGVSAFGGEGKSVLPLTPRCPYFTPGANNYNGFALEDTCGRCAHFRFGSISKCMAENGET